MTIRIRPIPSPTRLPYTPETIGVNLLLDESTRDNLNRLKVSSHQNIYDADFEYGTQPLRWESFTNGGGTVTHLPGQGGVRMRLTTAAGDVTIRQSRPYHRYQPGKTMFMASAVNFGAALSGQVARVGFFDDANGVFLEQGDPTTANPAGISAVVRSDSSGTVVDTKTSFDQFIASDKLRASIDWTRIQMMWIEYAWYGAGSVRWGIFVDGEPQVLHKIGFGNRLGQTGAWSRTGNLPVRYEQRNITAQSVSNDIVHYGVSVIVEGRIDDQRGFTYSYGMAPATPLRTVTAGTRFPLLSFRGRQMGTQEFSNIGVGVNSGAITVVSANTFAVTGTPFIAGALVGRCVIYGASTSTGPITIARIIANTTSQVTLSDNVLGTPSVPVTPATAPVVGNQYIIGQVNRGQVLPRQLYIQSSAVCVVEIIQSSTTAPIVLTAPAWNSLTSLGSVNSFAERDVSATALTGGEVVFAFVSPNNQLQTIDLANLFPLFNTIRGGATDILTVAITGTANVGAHFVCQEAMS